MADGLRQGLRSVGEGLLAFTTKTPLSQIQSERRIREQQVAAAEAGSQRQAEIAELRGRIFGVPQAPAAPQPTGLQAPAQPVSPGIAQDQGQVQPGLQAAGQAQPGLQAPAGLQAAPAGPAQRQDLNRLFQLDPAAATTVLEGIGALTDFQQENAASRAAEILGTPPELRERVIRRQAAQMQAEGRDPTDTLELLGMPTEQQDQMLNTIESAALTVKERRDERRLIEKDRIERATKKEKADLERDVKESKDRFDQAKKLRDEADKFEKPFREQKAALGRVETAGENALAGNTASEISLMFNFFKVLDPASTVREGEIATAEQAGANIPSRFVKAYNKLISGETGLNEDQINNILNESRTQFESSKKIRDDEAARIESLGNRFGIDRRDIFGDVQPAAETPAEPAEAAQQAPAAAQIPQGLIDNGDGTFTLPDGRIVRRTGG